MATEEIICRECFDSPTSRDTYNSSGDPQATTHLRITGTEDWLTARNAAINWVKNNRPKFGDLLLRSIEVKPIAGSTAWDANVEYSFKSSDTTKVLEYKFQTTSGTSKIEKSIATVTSKSCITGLPAYTFGGAVGVGDKGEIQGVEIKTPAFSWSQTQAFPVSQMTNEYKKKLASYTACVNSTTFAGFEPGEVLFEGISDGSLCHDVHPNTGSVYYYYKLTFSFSAMPNVTGVQVGDATVAKKGWEYMWILWETVAVQGGGTTKYPRNVCVEQVYPYANLNELGLLELG